MIKDYAVFLRNNQNPNMAPIRKMLTELGFSEVASLGSSGNFVFCAPTTEISVLERQITEAVGAEAIVRTRHELAVIVSTNPYLGQPGANLFLAREPFDKNRSVFQDAFGPQGAHPVPSGTTVYFVWPTRFSGRKAVVNFERELGVLGTMRTSKVIVRVLEKMNS
jgi:uncharacterized protein (DUF1697 family)